MKQLLGRLLAGSCIVRPVFIVGAGRSGTSVVLQALGKHPAVLAAEGESPLLTSIGGLVTLYSHDTDHDYFVQSLKVPVQELNARLRTLAFEIACGSNMGLGLLLHTLRLTPWPLRKRIWVAKTFPTENVTRGLQTLYPNMKLLYIVRNGLEVIQSRTRFHGFRDREFGRHCEVWTESVAKYRYLSSYQHAITLRHEQLVSAPRLEMSRIHTFLGLPDNAGPAGFLQESMVHPLDESTRAGTDVQQEFSRRKPPYESWTAEQRQMFKDTCGAAMQELGYAVPF